MPCTIIGAMVLAGCTAATTSPTTAVRILTASIQPYVAPPPKAERSITVPAPNPNWPFTSPATPIRPLSSPWSVTTVVGRNYLQTWFNGKPLHGTYRSRKAGR